MKLKLILTKFTTNINLIFFIFIKQKANIIRRIRRIDVDALFSKKCAILVFTQSFSLAFELRRKSITLFDNLQLMNLVKRMTCIQYIQYDLYYFFLFFFFSQNFFLHIIEIQPSIIFLTITSLVYRSFIHYIHLHLPEKYE